MHRRFLRASLLGVLLGTVSLLIFNVGCDSHLKTVDNESVIVGATILKSHPDKIKAYTDEINSKAEFIKYGPVTLQDVQTERISGQDFITVKGVRADNSCFSMAWEQGTSGKTLAVGNSCVGHNCGWCKLTYEEDNQFSGCSQCLQAQGLGAKCNHVATEEPIPDDPGLRIAD